MPSTLRTFVAIYASDEVRRQASRLIQRLEAAGSRVKWVEPENLHFTLKFLGDVEATFLPNVCRSVQQAAEEHSPFVVQAQGAGAFPSLSRPRTIWLGIGVGGGELTRLQANVETNLTKLGFSRENRRFEPHLTLGRVRGSTPQDKELARLLALHKDFPAGELKVTEVVVLSSELTPEGPQYDVVGRAPLG